MWVSLLWDQPAEGMGDLSDSSWRQRVIRRQLRWMRGPGDSCFQRETCQIVPSLPTFITHITSNRSPPPPRPGCPHSGKPLSLRIAALSTFGQLWAVTQEYPREGGPIYCLSSYPGASSVVVTCFCFLDRDPYRVQDTPNREQKIFQVIL